MSAREPAYRAWGRVTLLLAEAQAAAAVMNGAHDSADRVEATRRYVSAVDRMVAELGALKRSEALARIGVFLLREAGPAPDAGGADQ